MQAYIFYLQIVLISLGLMTSSFAHAEYYEKQIDDLCFEDDRSMYAGLYVKYSWVKARGDWSRIFVETHPGFGAHVGQRYCDNIGLELGYDATIFRNQNTSVPFGQNFAGVTNRSRNPADLPQNVDVLGKVQFWSFYGDINFYLPLFIESCYFARPEFIISPGIAWAKASIKIRATPREGQFAGALNDIRGKSRAITRFGLGFQGFFYKWFGFRAMVRWQNTDALRSTQGLAEYPGNRKMFKNELSANVGIFYHFSVF